jgi:hypothetical protein
MKNIVLALALWLAWAAAASAQVKVEVLMDRDQYLPNESIPVRVRIINDSGETLKFGQDKWLTYSVEARDGFIVQKGLEVKIPQNFEVPSSDMATTHADLAPSFDLSKEGRYALTVTAHLSQWDRNVTSPPRNFDIVPGVTVWDQTFGVPGTGGNGNEPEIRKYILQQATFVTRMHLYLRITDGSESRTIHVASLGPMISFSNPQMRLDKMNQLHLLFQQGAHIYTYFVFNPDGGVVARQTYFYSTSAPHLKTDEAGNPFIAGGVRHFADNDVPATRKTSWTNDIPSLSSPEP